MSGGGLGVAQLLLQAGEAAAPGVAAVTGPNRVLKKS